jgi:hypothetical protein
MQTVDEGFIIAGTTGTYSVDSGDAWLIKTDSEGNETWNKTFDGPRQGNIYDVADSVCPTNDGGYILTGYTTSGFSDSVDVWLIKTDENGNETWNKTFGGILDDAGFSVQQSTDGGYIIAGHTNSYGAGDHDVWLIKTDENGNETWNKTFGGILDDRGYYLQRGKDESYFVVGYTNSYGSGGADVWLIKVEAYENQPPKKPKIDGPSQGPFGTNLCWTFHSVDEEGDMVKYIINWGDGITDETNNNPPCTPVEVCHTYEEQGTYTIKAKAEDENGLISEESTFKVIIPRPKSRPKYNLLILHLLEHIPILVRLLNLLN